MKFIIHLRILLILSITLFILSACNKPVKNTQFTVRTDIEKYLFNISKEPDSTLAAILKTVSSKINYDNDDYINLLK